MQTDLAYINERAEELVAATPPVPTTIDLHEEIAGFRIKNEARVTRAHENMIEAAKDRAISYGDNRARLHKQLTELGIQPLAFLPLSMWQKICAESGLFRFSQDNNDRTCVTASNDIIGEIKERVEMTTIAVFTLLLSVTALVTAWLAYPSIAAAAAYNREFAAMMAVTIGVETGLAFMTLCIVNWLIGSERKSRWVAAQMLRGDKKRILAKLFPADETVHGSRRRSLSLKIRLPQPDEATTEVLKKLLQQSRHKDGEGRDPLTIRIAAPAEAIQLPADFVATVGKATSARIEEERADPIIYVHNDFGYPESIVVAIIAQFGDFPIEKEVVDRVVEEGL